MADPTRPEYRPDFAAVLAGVSVEGTEWVHLDWTRPHVRPEALLQVPLTQLALDDAGRAVDRTNHARRGSRSPTRSREAWHSPPCPTPGGPRPWLRTIVEQTMPDDETAVAALLHGEVDVLDRVPPWQVEPLARRHRTSAWKLRLAHGPRADLQSGEVALEGSASFAGRCASASSEIESSSRCCSAGRRCRGITVLSGPFPAGTSFSDPLRYAYNNQLEPRPFEPRLAAVLATVAWSKVLDPTGQGNIELSPIAAIGARASDRPGRARRL